MASRIIHGQARRSGVTETYRVWQNMIGRCENPKITNYKRYGGRGIVVCERWRFSYEAFYADMGEKPKGKTIERNDNNGRYELSNCRWATAKEQARNRSRTFFIEINGVKKSAYDWADLTGIEPKTIIQRFQRGWPTEHLFLPASPRIRHTKAALQKSFAEAMKR